MSLIECKDLMLGYDGKVVINKLNIKISKGDYLCIIGENGTGKSTLVKAILSLIKPMKGKISFSDELNTKQIGYLPQINTNQKDFPASVYEVVISGCLNKRGFFPFYKKEDKETVDINLKKLKIDNLKNTCFKELSGGQQQRVLLARALCATSKVLLLDEPTTALDTKTTKDFYKLIGELNKKDNITVIMVTHDIKNALDNATHILKLDTKDLFHGTKEEYIKVKGNE